MAERKAQSETRKAVTGKLSGKPPAKPGAVKKAAMAASAKPATKAASAKKPAAKKTAAPAAIKDASAKKAVPVKKAVAKKTMAVSGEALEKPVSGDRFRMVQTAAYFIAERQGFGGNPVDHWLAAEIEISRNPG